MTAPPPQQSARGENRGKVILAEPRGFCAGVRRAVMIVERALELYGPPVYVRKEIVHNQHVVRQLIAAGARFVDSEQAVPPGAVCVFSAHGVAPAVRAAADVRELRVIDATCPLVAKVHQEARRFNRYGRTILLIGHAEHEEVEGTKGEAPDQTVIVESVDDVARLGLPRDIPVAYLTQTTLSLDETADIVAALRDRFDDLVGPGEDDICYASQNRQNAVKELADRSDLVLVVGSRNSSNSIRMVEVARGAGVPAYLVPDATALDESWLADVRVIGLSAGASAPEILVTELLDRLAAIGYGELEIQKTVEETVVFSLPPAVSGNPMTPERSPMTAQAGTLGNQTQARAEVYGLLAQVEERMGALITEQRARWTAVGASAVTPVDEVAALITAGGKRLRPMFCLTGYLAAGGTEAQKVVDAAAALEFLHAFALIHDDVLDDSPLRRGAPTAHVRHADRHQARGWQGEPRRYGEGVAILAGDLAQVYADVLMADIPPLARDVWGKLRIEMIVGQFVDIASAARSAVSPALARWIAVCKSGRYTIHRPLQLGAAIAGRADLGSAFEPYGAALGEAFQLRDDLIDAFGDSATSGKPAGLDFTGQKMTLLVALAIEADKNVAELLRACAADGDAAALRDALDSLGVAGQVEQRIAALVEQARAAIQVAPISQQWKNELTDLAHQVAYRNK